MSKPSYEDIEQHILSIANVTVGGCAEVFLPRERVRDALYFCETTFCLFAARVKLYCGVDVVSKAPEDASFKDIIDAVDDLEDFKMLTGESENMELLAIYRNMMSKLLGMSLEETDALTLSIEGRHLQRFIMPRILDLHTQGYVRSTAEGYKIDPDFLKLRGLGVLAED